MVDFRLNNYIVSFSITLSNSYVFLYMFIAVVVFIDGDSQIHELNDSNVLGDFLVECNEISDSIFSVDIIDLTADAKAA